MIYCQVGQQLLMLRSLLTVLSLLLKISSIKFVFDLYFVFFIHRSFVMPLHACVVFSTAVVTVGLSVTRWIYR